MFVVPRKCIQTNNDFENYMKSNTFQDIIGFIRTCADSVVGVKNTDEICEGVSIVVSSFEELMNELFDLVDEVPPLQQPMRFGNKAFRTWHEKMLEKANAFLLKVLPNERIEATIELHQYFREMFGNETRIDYGTGHELNFALLFLCFYKLGLISNQDLKTVIVKGFVAYIRTMRRLQMDYMLEPAGSHGVWGLDDYHCLLFVWGSAQLARVSDTLPPSSIHHQVVLDENVHDYIYFEGIKFIKTIKSSAPFAETSPMLYDISGINEWAKVCSGLMKFFQAEVLCKFPVAQHILFGSILAPTWIESSTSSDVGK